MDEQAITDEDFANLLTAAGEEQPETDSDETPQDEAEEIEEPVEEEAEEGEPEEESDEPEEEESEDADEQPETDSTDGLIEYEIDGEKITATKDEAVNALRDRELMRADYTRKTQTLAQEREQFKQQQSEAIRFQQQYAAEIGRYNMVMAQVQQYDQVDWNQAFDADPVQASKAQAEYIRLQNESQRLGAELGNKQRYVAESEQAKDVEKINQVWAYMRDVDSGFNRERLTDIVQRAVNTFGEESAEAITSIRNPKLVEILNALDKKARAYDALQEKKPKAKAAIAASKVKQPAKAKPITSAKAKAIKKLGAKSSADDFAAALGASR